MSTLSAAEKKKKTNVLDESVVQEREQKRGNFSLFQNPTKKRKKLPNQKKWRITEAFYCIANDALPGIVKIGATVRDPTDRLSEARAVTWGSDVLPNHRASLRR